jgi:molybdenum-dependent DNA-binding transcriptional regulator ModE
MLDLARGGKERGKAVFTETGRSALKLYRRLEVRSLKACADIGDRFVNC